MAQRWLLLVALLLCAPTGSAQGAVDLIGTWHVLVHYKDSATANPDAERWDDRVWIFAMEGSRLRWTEYPIVVFDDASGRFEALGTNRQARVMHHWEPSPEQAAQIASGLEVNPRGSKSKPLRKNGDGWTSGSLGGAASMGYITYTETWSIRDADGLPVFSRMDSLGGGSVEDMDGRTLYTTERVSSDGDVLTGTFARDESRTGTFRLTRAGEVKNVTGSGKSQGQRTLELLGGPELAKALAPPEDASPAVETEVRATVRKEVEKAFREQGFDPKSYQPQVDDMTEQIMVQWKKGKSPEQIQLMIRQGRIAPRQPF